MTTVTPYQMAINNAAEYIRQNPPLSENHIDGFEFAKILSIVFCVAPEKIIADIVVAKIRPQ